METLAKEINYRNDVCPDATIITKLYKEALLNRPNDDLNRIHKMYEQSNIILSAWDRDKLVGILRGWTDGAFHGYICDLAVNPEYQKMGVGKELLNIVVSKNKKIEFVLRASVIAKDYYKHIGWEKMENGWYSPREN